jgi:protein involved in polysaccharide export with SLBB domain
MNQALRVALILAAFVGIFAAGAAVGGVVMAHFAKERFDRLDSDRKEEQRHHQQEQRRLAMMSEGLRMQLQRQQQDFQQQRQQLQQLQQQQASRGAQAGQPGRALPSPEQFGPQLMQRFVNQIQPRASNDQRDKIRPMVNQAAEDLRRLRRDTAHSTELILQQLQDQIAAVLTPEQRDHFTDAIARWRDAIQKYNTEQQQRQAQARLAEQEQLKRIQQRRQQQQRPPQVAGAPASPSPSSYQGPLAVSIQGAVKNPGRYDLVAGTNISVVDIVAKAGGFTDLAAGNDVRITHVSDVPVSHVDVEGIIKGSSSLKADDAALVVHPGDIIFVPQKP